MKEIYSSRTKDIINNFYRHILDSYTELALCKEREDLNFVAFLPVSWKAIHFQVRF